MRRHLWSLVLGLLLGALVLTSDARAWHMKKTCPPAPCASPQSAAPEKPSPPEEKKCPPKKCCCEFKIFPKHKSCFACPEKVVQPCIVPPCPAPPPPCPPIVCFG